MSEKLSGVWMRDLVALVAGPRSWSDTRESWLARAARRAGISYRQCKALFYGEIVDPYHRSARLMRDAAEALHRAADTLEHIDPDFHRLQIDARRDLARQLWRETDAAGDPDSSGTDQD